MTRRHMMFHGVGDDAMIFNPGAVQPRRASVINVLHTAPQPQKASVVNVLHTAANESTPTPVIPPLLDVNAPQATAASVAPAAPSKLPYYIAGGVVVLGVAFLLMRKH